MIKSKFKDKYRSITPPLYVYLSMCPEKVKYDLKLDLASCKDHVKAPLNKF